MSALHLDRELYRRRLGDPTTWSGDWAAPSTEPGDQFRTGNYLSGDRQAEVRARTLALAPMIVGLAIRGHRSSTIAAVVAVSRESVDRRLRPLGFKNAPGQVGRPARAL
jgi:hypothetical protein